MAGDDFTSGRGMTAQHAAVSRGPYRVAPTDGNARFNAIRIPLVAVACCRLNEPAFAFDSSFVSPNFAPELAKLAALIQANPGCPASIFAHADPVGSDAANKHISDRRATAIYGVLTRQPERWEELYSNPIDGDAWGTPALQTVLATVKDGSGSPYYADAVDGEYGPNTTDAVKRFQADAGVAADGRAGPATRKVLFGAYMDVVCTGASGERFTMKADDFLGGGIDPGGKMAMQGCSRFNPVVLLPQDEEGESGGPRNDDNAPNRRVLVFLFRPRQTDLSEWPCPRVKESSDACRAQFWPDGEQRRKNGPGLRLYKDRPDTMACRFYDRLARRSPCEGAVRPTVTIKLFDPYGEPIDGAPFEVVGPDFQKTGIAARGIVRLFDVTSPVSCTVRWSRTEPERRKYARDPKGALEPYEYAMNVFLDIEDTNDLGLHRRLNNMGHLGDLKTAVESFQRETQTTPTGLLTDVKTDLVHRHDFLVPPRHPKLPPRRDA